MAQNSNYITNFNGQTLFDILSSLSVATLTPASTYSNYFGYYFYLGDLLIQFTDLQGQNLPTVTGSNVTINYPLLFPTTPYIVLVSVFAGGGVNAPITYINNVGFVCNVGPSGNAGVPMFLAIGPRNGSYSNAYNVSNYTPSFQSINNNLISSTSGVPGDLGGLEITNSDGTQYIATYYARYITIGDLKIVFTDFPNTFNTQHSFNQATFRVYFPPIFTNTPYTVMVSPYGANTGNTNYNIQEITSTYFKISITNTAYIIQYLAIGT